MCLFENVFAVFVRVCENMSFGIMKQIEKTLRCGAMLQR